MENDSGFDNPFGAFSDLNFNIDDDDEMPMLLESSDKSEEENGDEKQESDQQNETLAIVPQIPEVLTIRPKDREMVLLMSPEEITTELEAYNMPANSLSALTPGMQTRLLSSLRKKQDVEEYQTIGAKQLHGEILPPAMLAASEKLADRGVRSELLTPTELAKIKRFTDYRPEDTDEKLLILRDIITQSKNAVRSRRDFADINSPYYNQEKADILEDTVDRINDYLRNGGYAEAQAADPEIVTPEERAHLIEEYGNDPFFRHAIRSELVEYGYLDEAPAEILGPLTEDDLSAINSIIAPSYAPKVSSRSIEGVAAYFPNAKRFFNHSRRAVDLTDAMLGKYIEEEVANERTLEPKSLVCGFLALEKEFFESGFTEKVKAFLEQNPNDSIEATLATLRRRFMYGGRVCNLLAGGKDTETRERFGTMVTTNAEFLDEVLQKAQAWTDEETKRKIKYQSGYIVKLDGVFDEVRIAYSGLRAIIENPRGTQDSQAEQDPESQKTISKKSVQKLLDVNSKMVDESQFTGEADIRIPEENGA